MTSCRTALLLGLLASASASIGGCRALAVDDAESATSEQTTYKPTWSKKSTTGGPGAQMFPRCVYDRARNAVVYFGGAAKAAQTGGPTIGDPAATYFWNGVSWSEAAAASAGPSPRASHAMAYDSLRKVVVVFGGERRQGYYLADTWEFDGTTWKEIPAPPGGAPPARSQHAMAFDEAHGKIVLHGGYSAQGALGDTWTWDGTTWQRVVEGSSAAGRWSHLMAYDPAKQRVVMLGGRGYPSDPGGALEWSGDAWQSMQEGSGGARFAGDLVYDTERGALVRYRGWGSNAPADDNSFNVHKELVNGAWRDVAAEGPGPRRDYGFSPTACVAYDEQRKVLVVARYDSVFPNTNNDVYELTWVPQANQAPAITPIGPQRVFAGEALALVVRATDPDDAAVQLTASQLPQGATFDVATNTLRWTPTPAQAGQFTIKIDANDGHGGFASSSIVIDVLHPTIASLPQGSIGLHGAVSVPMNNRDFCANSRTHTGCGPWASSARFDCTLAGQNPGKVVITCTGAFSVPNIGTNHSTWAPVRYQDVSIGVVATAVVDASGKFVFTDVKSPQGGRPGEFRSLGGRVELVSNMDVKLVITDARLDDVFGHGESQNSGPGETWLNPN